MDPTACLEEALRLLLELDADDTNRLEELLDAYQNWRVGGGFEPALGGDRVFQILKNAYGV